jgi:hypothetical protein
MVEKQFYLLLAANGRCNMKKKKTYLAKATRYLVGKKVPKQYNGNVGRIIEMWMSALGYKLNSGAGCDLKSIGTDIKSRTIESTSPYSIGSMTRSDIIKLPYESSAICKKFQYHYKVKHSSQSGKIVSAELQDYTAKFIQEKIKHAYESARELFKNGACGTYVRGENAWGYFEYKDSDSYTFRIPNSNMETLESMSSSNYRDLFSDD